MMKRSLLFSALLLGCLQPSSEPLPPVTTELECKSSYHIVNWGMGEPPCLECDNTYVVTRTVSFAQYLSRTALRCFSSRSFWYRYTLPGEKPKAVTQVILSGRSKS